MTYIVFTPNGDGSFLTSDPYTDLQAAKAATPSGGHVELQTDSGSQTVYIAM